MGRSDPIGVSPELIAAWWSGSEVHRLDSYMSLQKGTVVARNSCRVERIAVFHHALRLIINLFKALYML